MIIRALCMSLVSRVALCLLVVRFWSPSGISMNAFFYIWRILTFAGVSAMFHSYYSGHGLLSLIFTPRDRTETSLYCAFICEPRLNISISGAGGAILFAMPEILQVSWKPK